MPEIILDNGLWNTFQTRDITLHLCGHLVIRDKALRRAKQLYEILFGESETADLKGIDLKEFLGSITGNFAIIIESQDFLLAAVDITRTYPIFYSGESFEEVRLYSRLPITDPYNYRLNPDSVNEFFELGFITQEETLFKNLYQLRPGEYLYSEPGTCIKEHFFEYVPHENARAFTNISSFVSEFDEVLLKAFKDVIQSFPKHTQWVVPLSGGHDSRLIVNYLSRLNIVNVVCFTYGISENIQSTISRRVADAAGYKWHFVEYTEEKWRKLHDSGDIDRYVNYALNGVSTPHLQDFLAIHELTQQSVIGEGSVILPGHSSITENGYRSSDSDVADIDIIHLLTEDFNLVTADTHLISKLERICRSVSENPLNAYAYFNWQENQSKYIINSIRVYEYFNYNFAMPLWYKGVADFWLSLPFEKRVARNLFYEAESNGILRDDLLLIPFANDYLHKSKNRISFKALLKRMLPKKIISLLLKSTNKKEYQNEGLNQVFAPSAKTIGELMSPSDRLPESVQNYINGIRERAPHQLSIYKMSKLYTLKKIFESKNI